MKKIVTMAALASGALALAACEAKQDETPAEPVTEDAMMPAEEAPLPPPPPLTEETPTTDATPAEEELDPTGNPIVPG